MAGFNHHHALIKRMMEEDKALCLASQNNIERGVFVNGELHPCLKSGPIYFPKLTREAVIDHAESEDVANHEIWPARDGAPNDRVATKFPTQDRAAGQSGQVLMDVV